MKTYKVDLGNGYWYDNAPIYYKLNQSKIE